jgi:hypothetical protein
MDINNSLHLKMSKAAVRLTVLACASGKWVTLFRQTMPLTMSASKWSSVNTDDPSNPNYSILYKLQENGESYKSGGKFHFRLRWPKRSGVNTQEWKQSSNPMTAVAANGGVQGYEAVNAPFNEMMWGGLEYNGGVTLLDGSINNYYWFYAVGTHSRGAQGITGPGRTYYYETVTELEILVGSEAPTKAPTKALTSTPTKAPTAIPTISMADFKASASDSAPDLLKSGHDDVYKYSADGTKLTLKIRTDADLVAAEAKFKTAVGGFAGKNMPYMTLGMKKRYNGILVLDAQSDTPVLAAKTPYAISTSDCAYQGINGKKTFQGSCPTAILAFANGVNGAKVVGKGPHGAHDENMSSSIVPVDCADGFTASPEGSNPLVSQRCEPVDDSHIDGACTTDFNPIDDENTANCPAAHPHCVEWATAPSQKRCQRGRSTGYAWVNHGTCDPPPIHSELQTRNHEKL